MKLLSYTVGPFFHLQSSEAMPRTIFQSTARLGEEIKSLVRFLQFAFIKHFNLKILSLTVYSTYTVAVAHFYFKQSNKENFRHWKNRLF